ncbi:MAG TPA: prolipoprotein diacylglyceryl transferase [Actinomycetota bacterium]|nr:prolipoprotein diacylglyceryl transferase [Actinomycetota bacterium]
MFDPLSWPIIERIHLGPLAISPHGIGIAVGYLLGAQLMVRRARRFGGPPESDIWNVLFYALVGAIVGARVGYVLGHVPEVTNNGDDLLGVFRIWEGGISLIGGITGAVLFALPFMFKKKMGFWRTMDLAAPGMALGIVIGRIGDLIIGDHLGKPTSFPLGWRCSGYVGGEPPKPEFFYLPRAELGDPPSLGCFDVVVHQTALYDLISTLALLGVLLWLGKSARKPGFMILVFATWYGSMRIITDFLRVDRRYFGLTGSQLMSLAVVLAGLYILARWRGAPPRWATAAAQQPPEDADPDPDEALSPTESDEDAQIGGETPRGDSAP